MTEEERAQVEEIRRRIGPKVCRCQYCENIRFLLTLVDRMYPSGLEAQASSRSES